MIIFFKTHFFLFQNFRFDSDYLRLKKVNLLAYNYYDLIGDVIKAEHFAAQLNLHVWAKKLSQFDVSYKGTMVHAICME